MLKFQNEPAPTDLGTITNLDDAVKCFGSGDVSENEAFNSPPPQTDPWQREDEVEGDESPSYADDANGELSAPLKLPQNFFSELEECLNQIKFDNFDNDELERLNDLISQFDDFRESKDVEGLSSLVGLDDSDDEEDDEYDKVSYCSDDSNVTAFTARDQTRDDSVLSPVNDNPVSNNFNNLSNDSVVNSSSSLKHDASLAESRIHGYILRDPRIKKKTDDIINFKFPNGATIFDTQPGNVWSGSAKDGEDNSGCQEATSDQNNFKLSDYLARYVETLSDNEDSSVGTSLKNQPNDSSVDQTKSNIPKCISDDKITSTTNESELPAEGGSIVISDDEQHAAFTEENSTCNEPDVGSSSNGRGEGNVSGLIVNSPELLDESSHSIFPPVSHLSKLTEEELNSLKEFLVSGANLKEDDNPDEDKLPEDSKRNDEIFQSAKRSLLKMIAPNKDSDSEKMGVEVSNKMDVLEINNPEDKSKVVEENSKKSIIKIKKKSKKNKLIKKKKKMLTEPAEALSDDETLLSKIQSAIKLGRNPSPTLVVPKKVRLKNKSKKSNDNENSKVLKRKSEKYAKKESHNLDSKVKSKDWSYYKCGRSTSSSVHSYDSFSYLKKKSFRRSRSSSLSSDLSLKSNSSIISNTSLWRKRTSSWVKQSAEFRNRSPSSLSSEAHKTWNSSVKSFSGSKFIRKRSRSPRSRNSFSPTRRKSRRSISPRGDRKSKHGSPIPLQKGPGYKRTPEPRSKSPAYRKMNSSLVKHSNLPSFLKRSSITGRRSPLSGRRSPIPGRKSPAFGRSPISGRRSPISSRKSPAKKFKPIDCDKRPHNIPTHTTDSISKPIPFPVNRFPGAYSGPPYIPVQNVARPFLPSVRGPVPRWMFRPQF